LSAAPGGAVSVGLPPDVVSAVCTDGAAAGWV